MSPRKKPTPPPQPPTPYVPSEYEQGVIDTLALLKAQVDAMHDAERLVDRLVYNDPRAREFMGGIRHTSHLIDGVRVKVDTAAIQMISERRNKERKP